MKAVRILRIDPYRRTIAAMLLKAANDATPQIRRIIRANNVGSRQIMLLDGAPLMVVGGLDVDEAMKGWRLPGTDDTAGVAILSGRDEKTGLLVDVPATAAWVRERVQWLDGEDVGERERRASEIVPLLDADVREAISAGYVTPTGDIWISAVNKQAVGAALVTLGLGTERSGGQMLTKLGEAVHDILVDDAPSFGPGWEPRG